MFATTRVLGRGLDGDTHQTLVLLVKYLIAVKNYFVVLLCDIYYMYPPRSTFCLQISHDVLWVLEVVCFLSRCSCPPSCRTPSHFEWIDCFVLNFVLLAAAIGWTTLKRSPCRCTTSLWIDCWNCFGYARNPPRRRPLDRNRMFSPVCQCWTCIFFCLCPIFDRG